MTPSLINSFFVVQKAAAPENGVEFCQCFTFTISTLKTSRWELRVFVAVGPTKSSLYRSAKKFEIFPIQTKAILTPLLIFPGKILKSFTRTVLKLSDFS